MILTVVIGTVVTLLTLGAPAPMTNARAAALVAVSYVAGALLSSPWFRR
jgi:hypothetical protein